MLNRLLGKPSALFAPRQPSASQANTISLFRGGHLKEDVFLFLREEALPSLSKKNPAAALQVLDNMTAHGMPELESERQGILATRNAKYPLPAPADWSEVEMLRNASVDTDVCAMSPPVSNMYFVRGLKTDEGLTLPDDVLALYAAVDGFDLSLVAENYCPVFSLLPSESIDVSERAGTFPKRAVVFQGGDSIQMSIFRDRLRTWWLVYEYEYEPLAKIKYDLRALLQFGLARMNAPSWDALNGNGALSWEQFFEVGND